MTRLQERPAVVINADDLGYGAAVNQAIETALGQGRISSASLMANAPATGEGLQVARRHPQASFGIHLNLTEFQPLSDPEPLRRCGLLQGDCSFVDARQLRRLRPGPRLLAACYRELDRQIQHLKQQGFEPSHLDSHHHIHTIAWMLPVVRRLQRRHGIWRLRNTMNVYPAGRQNRPPAGRLIGKGLWQRLHRLGGGRMPQVFTDLELFLADPDRPEFRRAASIELMCHPGQSGFEAETHALIGSSAPLLDPCRYRLVSYQAI